MEHVSILAHLAPLLTNQHENVATDALAHLLLQYQFISEAFRENIVSAGIDLPDNLAIKTQARWNDAAIPDLVGVDEEGNHLLLVESKFWAYLTPNQPTTYIERLYPNKPGILLFVAPASRIPTLWQKLLGRCGYSNDNCQEHKETQFLTLHLNRQHFLALTSWESLLAVFQKKAQQVGDGYAVGDIWQLQSLCARIDAEAFKPLSGEEIIAPTKKRIEQFRDLVDELVIRLKGAGIVSTKGYKATPGPNYYKRYMTINNIPNWCIEYNDSYRREHPPTSLWLTITESRELSGLLSELAPVSYRQQLNKQFLIPLEIPVGVEKDDVISSLFRQVADFSKHLNSR
jgi:hypothetical protein